MWEDAGCPAVSQIHLDSNVRSVLLSAPGSGSPSRNGLLHLEIKLTDCISFFLQTRTHDLRYVLPFLARALEVALHVLGARADLSLTPGCFYRHHGFICLQHHDWTDHGSRY